MFKRPGPEPKHGFGSRGEKDVKRGSCLVIGWLLISVFQGASQPARAAQQNQSPEDEVRDTIRSFQKGVEAGDKTLGRELAVEDFAGFFVPFYEMLADAYSGAGAAFPVEIGHIKVLGDGRAKVETYLNPGRNLFIFTLIKDKGRWKICHLEGILFPVFDVPALPASSVLELPPDKVKWMMCERDVAFRMGVFDKLKTSLGPQAARGFFVGQAEGWREAMDAWLPFIEGASQFALFYGILEENYYGSKYIITRADEDEAEIRFSPLQELEVMKIAVFYPKMSMEEYREFYKDILTERARVCGLDLEVSFEGTNCTLRLKRIKNK